jgi:dihydroxyacetone kinase
MVVVAEDCAIDNTGLAGRRGLAGTCFVHKVRAALC